MTTKTTEDYNFREPATSETEALSILAFEFAESEQGESDRRIRRRLRDKKLGPYDTARVNSLRALKDDIREELEKRDRSEFYKPLAGHCSDLGDWQFVRLAIYCARRHPKVDPAAIRRFLPYAIYLYYLR
jgi:hypothetical protein